MPCISSSNITVVYKIICWTYTTVHVCHQLMHPGWYVPITPHFKWFTQDWCVDPASTSLQSIGAQRSWRSAAHNYVATSNNGSGNTHWRIGVSVHQCIGVSVHRCIGAYRPTKASWYRELHTIYIISFLSIYLPGGNSYEKYQGQTDHQTDHPCLYEVSNLKHPTLCVLKSVSHTLGIRIIPYS